MIGPLENVLYRNLKTDQLTGYSISSFRIFQLLSPLQLQHRAPFGLGPSVSLTSVPPLRTCQLPSLYSMIITGSTFLAVNTSCRYICTGLSIFHFDVFLLKFVHLKAFGCRFVHEKFLNCKRVTRKPLTIPELI